MKGKNTYNKALKDDRWLIKRKRILERDEYRCVECGYRHKLQVHHLGYKNGKMPWDIGDEWLKTLCDRCHREWHNKNKPKVLSPKRSVSRNERNDRMLSKLIAGLSSRDKELMSRYDKIK